VNHESMNVLIASPLEPEFVDRVRAVDGVEVCYAPELLPRPRYPNDHAGEPVRLDSAGEARWNALVARAQAVFGYPLETSASLARVLEAGPGIVFVQGTSAGMGAHVKRANLPAAVLRRVAFASAAGVHAGMLAEYALYGLLAIRKDAPRLARLRAERRWEHFAPGELDGSALGILGMGQIGSALAVRARAFGMTVIGFNRSGSVAPNADETYPTSSLRTVAPRLDALAITLPITDLTTGMVSAEVIAALRPNAVVINVGRGAVADEAALVAALAGGSIAGAVLDVFATEPLPAGSPLWTLPNVVMSPHTAALSIRENARIVDIFIENLGRLARGERLRNALNLTEFY
jgi:phosphoglycerate dehydrogenase-like enzyme